MLHEIVAAKLVGHFAARREATAVTIPKPGRTVADKSSMRGIMGPGRAGAPRIVARPDVVLHPQRPHVPIHCVSPEKVGNADARHESELGAEGVSFWGGPPHRWVHGVRPLAICHPRIVERNVDDLYDAGLDDDSRTLGRNFLL